MKLSGQAVLIIVFYLVLKVLNNTYRILLEIQHNNVMNNFAINKLKINSVVHHK